MENEIGNARGYEPYCIMKMYSITIMNFLNIGLIIPS